MKTSAFLLALTLLAPTLFIQANAQESQAAASACPTVATLDQLPKALDEAISGPSDKDRACLRQLMSPDVRLVLVTGSVPRLLTFEDWIEAMRKRGSAVMIERQIKVRTETFANIAHLWSTYEIRTSIDGPPISRGINSVQAFFDGERWKVVEVLWTTETPTAKIPE